MKLRIDAIWREIITPAGEQVYKLAEDVAPRGVGIIVVPHDGDRYRIAATYNRERFYLMGKDDKPRSFNALRNAKMYAKELAPTADELQAIIAERNERKQAARPKSRKRAAAARKAWKTRRANLARV